MSTGMSFAPGLAVLPKMNPAAAATPPAPMNLRNSLRFIYQVSLVRYAYGVTYDTSNSPGR